MTDKEKLMRVLKQLEDDSWQESNRHHDDDYLRGYASGKRTAVGIIRKELSLYERAAPVEVN